MSKKIYLSGACKNVDNNGNIWRKAIKSELECSTYYNCFNPNDYYNYTNLQPITDKECMSHFLYNLRTSDLVIVNLKDSDKSVGTGMELMLAHELHKPIIGFNNDNTTYPWARELCDVILDSEEDVVDYIRIYY